jgi:hypothetical protein
MNSSTNETVKAVAESTERPETTVPAVSPKPATDKASAKKTNGEAKTCKYIGCEKPRLPNGSFCSNEHLKAFGVENPQPAATTAANSAASANPANVPVRICQNPGCGQMISSTHLDAVGCSNACTKIIKATHALTPSEKTEAESQVQCEKLLKYIAEKKGGFLVDEEGAFSLRLDGKRIPLDLEPDNHLFSGLLIKVCNVTSAFFSSAILKRLNQAAFLAVGKLRLRKFSAMSEDDTQLYIPIKDTSKLLHVTAKDITDVDNGTNKDEFWVEHPTLNPDAKPFEYVTADPKAGLADFERLIIDKLPCRVPSMAWFVAMEEILFSFVRETCLDRVITHHEGPTGSGKTSAAELVCAFLGLDTTGDTTPAVLNRLGDCGLLVMDDKEHANMTTGFTSFILYLATGSLRLRCARTRGNHDGYRVDNKHRPVGVITSVEGAYQATAIRRLVEVSFNAQELDRGNFPKKALHNEVRANRNVMLSALMPVLQRFLQINAEGRTIAVPQSLDSFGENFKTLVKLMTAYADVAGKSDDWITTILKSWADTLQAREVEGDELVSKIEKFLRLYGNDALSKATGNADLEVFVISCATVTYEGHAGPLTVTTTSQMLDWLQREDRFSKTLPMGTIGLGRKLRSIKTRSFIVLDEDSGLEQLKRKDHQRFIGFFQPNDGVSKVVAAPDTELEAKLRNFKPLEPDAKVQ